MALTVAALAVAMLGASSASAQLLPAELGGLLKDLRIPGIAESKTTANEASATAVDLGEVAVIGKGETNTDSAKVTRLALLGEVLLAKNAQGENEGALAPVGDLVDQINAALCSGGPDQLGTCISVLHAQTADNTEGDSTEQGAHSSVLQLSAGETGIYVLPATAITGTQAENCRTLSASDTAALGTIDGEIIRIGSTSEEKNNVNC